jgi:rubrerythrin
MGMPFNADEIFEMAQEIEKNGAKFYRAAAKKFQAVSGLFNELAEMEDKHLKTFTDMRAQLDKCELEPAVFDPDGQGQMYLQVMADGHVFDIKSDPAKLLANLKTAADVLKMAIGMEKDSIAFYVGLRESVAQSAGKEKVDAIIREEFGHIVTLGQKLKQNKL